MSPGTVGTTEGPATAGTRAARGRKLVRPSCFCFSSATPPAPPLGAVTSTPCSRSPSTDDSAASSRAGALS